MGTSTMSIGAGRVMSGVLVALFCIGAAGKPLQAAPVVRLRALLPLRRGLER